MAKNSKPLAVEVGDAISLVVGQPSSTTTRCMRWCVRPGLDLALQLDSPVDIAYVWIPWPIESQLVPEGAEYFDASASRHNGLTAAATPSLTVGKPVARLRLDRVGDIPTQMAWLWNAIGLHESARDPESQSEAISDTPVTNTTADGSRTDKPSKPVATRSRGQLTELFLRGGWGPIAIAAVLVGAWLISDLVTGRSTTHPMWVSAPALGVVCVVIFTLLLWPAKWLLVCAASGGVTVVAFMGSAADQPHTYDLHLVYLPLIWLALQIWLIRQWWQIHDAGPTDDFTLRNLPRAKYLPTLVGMSLSTLVSFDYLSRALLDVGIVEAVPLALQGTIPPMAQQITSLLQRLPNLQFSLYGLLLCATSALAVVAGDTELSETVKRWAMARSQDIALIRGTLNEQAPDDAVDATVYKRLSHELAYLAVQLRIVTRGVWLAFRAFPQLMAAGLLDLIKTGGINAMAAFLLLIRLLTGAAAGFACGAVLAMAVEELLCGYLGTASYWSWGPWSTLFAFGIASGFLCLIAEWHQISCHLRSTHQSAMPGPDAAPGCEATKSNRDETHLVFYPLRAFVVCFVAFPVSLTLTFATLHFLSAVSVVDEVSLSSLRAPGIRVGRWVVIGTLVASLLLGFGYTVCARSRFGRELLAAVRSARVRWLSIEHAIRVRDRLRSITQSLPAGYEKLKRVAHGQGLSVKLASELPASDRVRIGGGGSFELRSGDTTTSTDMFAAAKVRLSTEDQGKSESHAGSPRPPTEQST